MLHANGSLQIDDTHLRLSSFSGETQKMTNIKIVIKLRSQIVKSKMRYIKDVFITVLRFEMSRTLHFVMHFNIIY